MRDYRDAMQSASRATEGDAASFARVEARARAEAAATARSRAKTLAVGVPLVALAAGVLWALQPPPRVDRAFTEPATLALGSFVQVQAAGAGEVTGVAKKMDVRWSEGRLGVEVEPQQGVEFVVRTEEATVRVVGTGFDVVRDALGTSVSVRHGRVAVDCAEGGSVVLGVGESRVCRPTHAAGALGRVLALQPSASPAALLVEVDDALALPDASGPVAAELRALRVSALLAGGREADALAEAKLALTLPDVTRADELHRLAARLAAGRGDCAAALPHLLVLEAEGTLGEDAPALALCRAR